MSNMKHLCRKCWNSYGDYYHTRGAKYTVECKCEDCGRKSLCTYVNAVTASTGVDPESDAVTKVDTIAADKPKPVAINKKEKKKFNMKINHKPKGSSNAFTRRKT